MGYAPPPSGLPASLKALLDKLLAAARSGTPTALPTDVLRLKQWSDRLSPEEISTLIVPKRTLARRVAAHQPLSPDETDRAARVGRILTQADRVFGNPEKAGRWLRRPNSLISGQRPLDLLSSEAGAQVVDEMLGQIDHGMFT